jgi:hypothetical protein
MNHADIFDAESGTLGDAGYDGDDGVHGHVGEGVAHPGEFLEDLGDSGFPFRAGIRGVGGAR